MAAFSLSADTNIDALTSKGGGDTYDTNGWILTIDQDSRVGLNQTTSTSLGSITINATKGGKCNIDGRAIWIIPYTGGGGIVPAWNTAITNGTGTGKLIGVHSALTAASTATGAAMPATGFIRVKQMSGAYVAGALTGITASASDAGRIGWLEVVGDEGATVNANRLGEVNFTGAWFSLGTTSGAANQTFQIPNNGLLRYSSGIYIEKTSGQGDYEFYPNAGTATTIGTDATRGKVCWINNAGLARIGDNGSGTMGYTPAANLAVVFPNIILENCTTAARTANVIPNATIATRYDFTCTGGGVVNMDKVDSSWYLSFSQAYSVTLTNTTTIDGLLLTECATPIIWSKVGVGNKPTTALLMSGLTMTYCYAGGTLTDCVWDRVSLASSGSYTSTISDIAGFTFTRCIWRANTNQGNASVNSIYATRMKNCTFTDNVIIEGAANLITCDGITMTDTIFTAFVSGTTGTTYATYVWNLSSNTVNSIFSGLTLPVTNTHPYTAIMIAATGCSNIKLRNIGTYASPLTMGSANACGLIYTLATNCSDFKFQRIYVANTRTNTAVSDNSCIRITEESVISDYGDAPLSAALNLVRKNGGSTNAVTAQTSVYGTHWEDFHTSTSAGRILIMMNEPNALTTTQVALTGGAAFTSTGGLYMPTIGMTATFETPYFIIGHTGFANSAAVMGGGTIGNYRFEYSIDINDGNGWSAMTSSSYTAAQLGTALNGITGINATLGFKLKIKITTGTGNTTAITSLYLITTSTTTTQAYQYPLDNIILTLTSIVSGSDVVIYATGTTTVRQTNDAIGGTSITYQYETPENIDIGIFKIGYIPLYVRNYPLGSTDASLPMAQILDRAYLD